MSNFFHGVRKEKQVTSVSTPITSDSGIHFVVGLAPVHTVGGSVNEPILVNSYADGVAMLGYSDDWGTAEAPKYTLCEEMYAAFKLYGISPIVLVNVLDPAKHKKTVEAADYDLSSEKTVLLPLEALKDTVTVTGYEKGTDYECMYTDTNLVIEVVEGGSIGAEITSLNIAYTAVDPSKVTKKDIIGGYDVATNKYSGLELVDMVFPKHRVIADLILCPGFSHDPEVAAVMDAKTESINGLFEGKCVIDVDTTEVLRYADVPAWKNSKNITKPSQIIVWPMCKLGDKVFHYSVQEACRITATDCDASMGDGTPCESPSNKSLQVDSMVLADGTEVLLDLNSANYLNENGIVTALNLMGGYVSWGNSTACYPSNTDVTDYFIAVSRMFAWVGNSIILSVWDKVDRKLNRRLIESVVQTLNLWMNGLTSEEKILGGRVEFLAEENSDIDLMAGKIKIHVYMTPPSPAQEFDFLLEYDTSYLSSITEG